MHKPDIWMPFYVNDYLGDTMHLTREEHGGYLLLILAYWKKGAALPGDSDPLSMAAIVKATPEEWQRTLNARLRPFFQVDDNGLWHHKRIDVELAKATASIEQKRRAGLASANARSNARSTHVTTDVPTNVLTGTQRSEGVCEGEGNGSSYEGGMQGGKPRFTPADSEEIYERYPRHVGKAAAIVAIQRAMVRVLSNHPDDAKEWLLGRVATYASSPAGNAGKFTPHPATWFNQERYLDDDLEWSKEANNGNGNHQSQREQRATKECDEALTF